MDLVIIAAVAENGVIGSEGEIPWYIPEDLARFKDLTTGHPVVMGRVTYESIVDRLGGPLPDRTSVVLTSGDVEESEDIVAVGSVEEALDVLAEMDAETAFVAGGETVYEQFLPRADRLELTELEAAHEGDTHFPEWNRDEWAEAAREEHEGFAFVSYERAG